MKLNYEWRFNNLTMCKTLVAVKVNNIKNITDKNSNIVGSTLRDDVDPSPINVTNVKYSDDYTQYIVTLNSVVVTDTVKKISACWTNTPSTAPIEYSKCGCSTNPLTLEWTKVYENTWSLDVTKTNQIVTGWTQSEWNTGFLKIRVSTDGSTFGSPNPTPMVLSVPTINVKTLEFNLDMDSYLVTLDGDGKSVQEIEASWIGGTKKITGDPIKDLSSLNWLHVSNTVWSLSTTQLNKTMGWRGGQRTHVTKPKTNTHARSRPP